MPYSHLSGAVISGGELSEHEAEMVQKTVAVRDGDATIVLDAGNPVSEDEDNGFVSVSINTTGEDDGEQDEGETVGEEADSADSDVPDFKDVDPTTMNDAGAMLAEAEAGQQEILSKAKEGGVTDEQLDAMKAEYESNGKLSDEQFNILEAAGLSRNFVNSFMAGQQAVGERFAKTVIDYVGGDDNFGKLSAFIADTNPGMAEAFNSAMERLDVATIRTLLDTGKTLMRVQFGTRPTRSLTTAAKPVAVSPSKPQVQGFESRAEMVKAMSDKRYERDAAYRKEVEMKVIHSKF